MRKIVFITTKCIQRKTLPLLKTDVFKLLDDKNIENCFQNMNCFPWIKLTSFLIHLK